MLDCHLQHYWQKNFATIVDISEEKVNLINNRISPIDDEYIKVSLGKEIKFKRYYE